jgi:hypothetical protein
MVRRLMLTLACVCAAGCGSSAPDNRPERVPVVGVVKYKQQPVEGAVVVFNPQGHPHAAIGRTDADGRFELMTFEPGDGAVAGEYLVSISKIEAAPVVAQATDDAPTISVPEKPLLPDVYADPQTSGFKQTIMVGREGELTFDLKEGPIGKLASNKRRMSAGFSGE